MDLAWQILCLRPKCRLWKGMVILMKKYYSRILADSDQRVQKLLPKQVTENANDFYYGGFRDTDALVEPKYAIYCMTSMAAAYFNERSRWYLDTQLFEKILLAVDYIKRGQRENGFFDLINCNFYSAPDTAFCIKRLLPLYHYLIKHDTGEYAVTLISPIRNIIHNGAWAMAAGGFHTPNHRWAIASCLLLCARMFQEPKFETAANKYLVEGIDCNSDGEFAEKSAGNYNRINNDAMIMLTAATGDRQYEEYAIRNLYMMMTYLEPDGSIFTNNSTRQDRGKRVYSKDYYFEFLYLGEKYKDDNLLNCANYIMEVVLEKGQGTMDCLIHYMNFPHLKDLEHEGSLISTTYEKQYRDSNIVRCRNGNFSYTILSQNSTFLYFQNGDLTLSLKIGASFCEHRAFQAETLEKTEQGYRLSQQMTGWYYLPFEKSQDSADWWSMNNDAREKIYGPDMNFEVCIQKTENGIDVKFKVDGIDKAPIRIEAVFDSGARIESENFMVEGQPGGYIVAKSGMITVSHKEHAIRIGEAFGAHNFVTGKFGSEPVDSKCFTVYFTDFTCCEHTLSIRAATSKY